MLQDIVVGNVDSVFLKYKKYMMAEAAQAAYVFKNALLYTRFILLTPYVAMYNK